MFADYKKLSLPVDFVFPPEFAKIVDLNIVNIEPWFIISPEKIVTLFSGLKEKFPTRCLIPFSKRDDNDDVACFEVGQKQKVFIIHDYATAGWEQHEIYDDFWK